MKNMQSFVKKSSRIGRFALLLFMLNALFTSVNGQNLADKLREETRLDMVSQTGDGVILAMIERGIDYRHPDFIDANGKTRIAYIFDMTDPSGAMAPNNSYGRGTIYSRAEIDQALSSGNALATMDRHGHGTASTGIAAGNGSAVMGTPYPGVATEATIIAVKMIQDPFPAGGGQPAQTGYFDPTDIPVALQFVKDKSIELGLPSVSLMNFGSIGGPTDGTSNICAAMDAFVGPGRLLVCGVGDDGGEDNHAEMTVSQGNPDEFEVNKAEAGNLRFEAWYDGGDRFDITVIRPNGTQEGPYTAPANNAIDWQTLTGIQIYHNGSDRDFSQATNGKRQVMIDFSGATGVYKVKFTGTTVSNGKIDASLNPSTYYNNNKFVSHVVPGHSINDYASALQAIVPTDYVHSNSYKDMSGATRNRTGEGAPGELWIGSSAGPTLDGRRGVDIAVPGELNVGAYSAGTYYSRFAHLLVEGGNNLYGIQNAVSGAAPVLTGMLALMLEINPDLTVQQAKDILHQTARSDAFTGMTPNPDWGYGKLDAQAAIVATQATVSIEENSFADLGIQVYPNPAKELLYYRWEDFSGEMAELTVLDLTGRSIQRFTLSNNSGRIQLGALKSGIYILRVKTENKIGVKRLVVN
jgi:hypothetical protein